MTGDAGVLLFRRPRPALQMGHWQRGRMGTRGGVQAAGATSDLPAASPAPVPGAAPGGAVGTGIPQLWGIRKSFAKVPLLPNVSPFL